MSTSTAELTLIIRAQNLAEAEFAKVKTQLTGIATTAGKAAAAIESKFKGIGHRIANQFGYLTTDLLSGGKIEDNLKNIGALMAGAIVEGLAATLLPKLLAKLAETQVFAEVAAAFAAGGVTAGTVFDSAVAITMAALPFVILAAALAALAYLIANPEARQRAHDVAMMILGQIGDGLRALGKILFDRFQAGFGVLVGVVTKALNDVLAATKKIVGNIVDVILFIPRTVATALDALANLGGVSRDILDKNTAPRAGGNAAGGWVGLHGPELSWLGEKGPEYVVPNHQLGKMAAPTAVTGVTIRGVSEREIMDMVDRGMYFKLQRAAPTLSRT